MTSIGSGRLGLRVATNLIDAATLRVWNRTHGRRDAA